MSEIDWRTEGRNLMLKGMLYLLPPGGTWRQQDRDRWLDLLIAIIDLCMEVSPGPAERGGLDEGGK